MRTKGTCLVCFGGEGDIHSSFATCPFPFLGGSNTAGHGYVLQKPAFITARKRSLRRLCFYRCLSVHNRGGACVVALGGRAWFCPGEACMVLSGGVCGFVRGACVVALGGGCVVFVRGACMVLSGGHAWLLGGRAWFCLGGCVWFCPGGMHGFVWGGMRSFSRGACMVFSGGRAWFFSGGCMVFSGGACMVFSGGRGGVHRIRRDTVNERAVRILLECILLECILVTGVFTFCKCMFLVSVSSSMCCNFLLISFAFSSPLSLTKSITLFRVIL